MPLTHLPVHQPQPSPTNHDLPAHTAHTPRPPLFAVPASKQGWHAKVESLVKHEDIRAACLTYIRTSPETKKGVLSDKFHQHVNNTILPAHALEIAEAVRSDPTSREKKIPAPKMTITKRKHEARPSTAPCSPPNTEPECLCVAGTARRWLVDLGLECKEQGQGVYFDGHERADVRAYRDEFVSMFLFLSRSMEQYVGEGVVGEPPSLSCDEKEHVWVTHDEATFWANDDAGYVHLPPILT